MPALKCRPQTKPLTEGITFVCSSWKIAKPEDYSFKLEDHNVYVTEKVRCLLKFIELVRAYGVVPLPSDPNIAADFVF